MVGIKHTKKKLDVSKKDAPKEKDIPLVRYQANGSRYAFWGVAIVCVLFCLFALSYLILNAVITITPKMQEVALNENISGSKTGGAGAVPFDLIVISGEEHTMVQPEGEKDFSERAKGVVVIYNTFGSLPQSLLIDTRLEGSNGKMYKTEKPIVVPGMKGSIPGSVEVGIYGTDPGQD